MREPQDTQAQAATTATTATPANLPPGMIELAGVIGLAGALALARAWGGITLKVPASDYEGITRAWLIDLIGGPGAAALIQRYRGERLYIPRCEKALRDARDSEIIRAYDAGTPAVALALQYRLTERQVRSILKRTPEVDEAVQAGLF